MYPDICLCPKCGIPCKTDHCPKCNRKVTCDSIKPRREKDLVDLFTQSRFEFRGIKIESALELMTNGCCGD